MKYGLTIREGNIEPHLDIEKEISKKKSGLFTCIIRCNAGNIVDVVLMEYANATDYLQIKSVIIEEYTFAFDLRTGSPNNGVRTTNGNSTAYQRTSQPSNFEHS